MTGRTGSETGASVALLWDPRWPDESGVCCWRHAAREAFAATGAAIREAVAPADLLAFQPPPGGRRIVRAARRMAGVARDELRRRSPAVRALRTLLGGAALVVAESPAVAGFVLGLGQPGRTVWLLALPPDRQASDNDPYTGMLANLAPRVAGFVSIDESGREAVERATAAVARPRVEIFPPVARDRPCPTCSGRDAPRDDVPADRSALVSVRAGRTQPEARLGWAGDLVPAADQAPPLDASGAATRAGQDRVALRVVSTVRPRRPDARPQRDVMVSGYDLKFARELAARLDTGYSLRMHLDEWPGIRIPSTRTAALAASATSILAEWARPNAAWLAQRKRPGQLLVVRLHRYELTTRFPAEIDIDRVDAVVHVSRHLGREIVERLDWPEHKLVHIPNYLDIESFDRPKLPGARFGIGAVGIDLANKRFDLMLDVIAEVRRLDPRFTLFVRSTLPWDNRYAWLRPAEREYVDSWLRRIDADPLLRGGVIFDEPGRDMARWWRRVGVVLSTSDIESFHLAVAEGMASGAVPVIRPRPGAAEIFGPEWIVPTTDDAVSTILACADEDVWNERAAAARIRITEVADPSTVLAAWADLLHGDLGSARRHFAAAPASRS